METLDSLYRESGLKIDGRVKTLSTFILLFTVAAMQDIYIPLVMLAVALALVFMLRIPVRKLLYLLYVASVVFAVVLFTVPYGRTLWQWWVLRVISGSFYLASLILVKVLVCVSLLLILAATTRMYEIVSALSWLPEEVLEIALLMLRYIETLSRISKKLHMAAKARGAFSKEIPFWRRIYNTGSLAGVLVLRAMDKAERIYLSMVARGYTGKLYYEKVDRSVFLKVLPVLALCILAICADRLILKAPYVMGR